jgi:hypothetical protein
MDNCVWEQDRIDACRKFETKELRPADREHMKDIPDCSGRIGTRPSEIRVIDDELTMEFPFLTIREIGGHELLSLWST